jgi:photosystem II stability/assembly factor-like uncharacterized protein
MGKVNFWIHYAFLCVSMGIAAQAGADDRLSLPSVTTQNAANSLLLDIAASDQAVIAVGEHGTLVRKTPNSDWSQQTSPTSELLTAVQFVTETHVLAVGHGGVVLQSHDAGEHWSFLLDGNAINQLHVNAYQGFLDTGGDPALLDFPLDEYEYLLDDAKMALEEGPIQPLLNLYFLDNHIGFLMGAYGTLLKTRDGGESWTVLSHRVPNPDRFHLTAMTQWNDALWMVGEAGLMFTSDDLGEHWNVVESPYEGSWFDVAVVDQSIVLAGLRGHLFTKREGADWQPISAGEKTLTHISTCDDPALGALITGFGGIVLSFKDEVVAPMNVQGRQAFSSAACWQKQWYLVGEEGVNALSIPNASSIKELP